MRSQLTLAGLLFGALMLMPTAVQAHNVPGGHHTMLTGLVHPLSGLDHLAVMIGVGLLGGQLGGRALWLLPAIFVGVMSLGAGFGAAGFGLPMVEPMILLSVFILGSMILSARSTGLTGTAVLVGAMALFHGHAHGTELGVTGEWAYLPGMIAATAVLHGLGIAFGVAARATAREQWVRVAGGGIVACGAALFLGLL